MRRYLRSPPPTEAARRRSRSPSLSCRRQNYPPSQRCATNAEVCAVTARRQIQWREWPARRHRAIPARYSAFQKIDAVTVPSRNTGFVLSSPHQCLLCSWRKSPIQPVSDTAKVIRPITKTTNDVINPHAITVAPSDSKASHQVGAANTSGFGRDQPGGRTVRSEERCSSGIKHSFELCAATRMSARVHQPLQAARRKLFLLVGTTEPAKQSPRKCK